MCILFKFFNVFFYIKYDFLNLFTLYWAMGLNYTKFFYTAEPTLPLVGNNDFLVSSSYSYFLYSNTQKGFTNSICISQSRWANHFFNYILRLPVNLVHLVDGAIWFSNPLQATIQFNTNNMLLEDRETLITSSQVSALYNDSISKIIPSSVWLERELSDFSGLSFFGLIDTRRLLLDYLETKQVWQTHLGNDKSFNNSIYDISVNF